MKYMVHYASSSTALTAAEIRAVAKATEADTNVNIGGVKEILCPNVLIATIAGKAFVDTVYIVVESINDNRPKFSTDTKSYMVTGTGVPPAAVMLTPTSVTAGTSTFTVNVPALTMRTVTLTETLCNTMNEVKRNSVFGSQVTLYLDHDGDELWCNTHVRQAVISGSTVTKPDNPTKANFVFFGWYMDSALTTEFNFATPITKDTILYAKCTSTWTTVNAGTYHTVDIKADGTLLIWGVEQLWSSWQWEVRT